MGTDNPAVMQAVKESAKNNKLPCTEALVLADLLGVNPKKIGEAADELNIKIVNCQLGCF